MTEKKVTKREKFGMLLAMDEIKSNAMLKEFIEHEIELLENKNGSKKQTKTQKDNEGIKELIVNEFNANPNKLYTIGDMHKAIQSNCEIELSNQRVSALMRQLRLDGVVERIEDKRKAYFKLA